jgi:nucleotide-binding universal stress UspA family protein
MAVVNKVKEAAEAEGIRAKAVTTSSDFAAEAIINAAKKYKCDLIVMASHGRRGMKRLLMGSETMHVLTHSHIPVLVLR